MFSSKAVAYIVLIAVLVPMVLIVSVVLVMALWYWVVPDVFAGAVKQGFLPDSLSFLQALKLSLLLWGLGLASRTGGSSK